MTVTIEEISTLHGFQQLEGCWDQLLDQTPRPHIFLTWDWLYTWWKYFGKDKSLLILVARDERAQVIGMAPCFVTRQRWGLPKLCTVKFLGTEIISSEYLDFIIPRDCSPEIAGAFVHHLSRRASLDLQFFSDLVQESNVIRFLTQVPGCRFHITAAEICPHIVFPSRWQEYQQSLSSKARSYIRQILRFFLDRSGGALKKATPENYQPVLGRLFELHTERWAAQGYRGSFATEDRKSFHREVAGKLAEKSRLGLYYLEVGGQIVSVLYGFSYLDTFYFYQGGFDRNYRQHSPGQAVLHHAIQDCFESGLRRFDFLRGEEEYKLKWANAQTKTYNALVPVTAKARLVLKAHGLYLATRKGIKRLLGKQAKKA